MAAHLAAAWPAKPCTQTWNAWAHRQVAAKRAGPDRLPAADLGAPGQLLCDAAHTEVVVFMLVVLMLVYGCGSFCALVQHLYTHGSRFRAVLLPLLYDSCLGCPAALLSLSWVITGLV